MIKTMRSGFLRANVALFTAVLTMTVNSYAQERFFTGAEFGLGHGDQLGLWFGSDDS